MRLRGALAAVVAVAALGGCSHFGPGGSTGAQGAGPIAGTLRFAGLDDVASLNPLLREQAAGTDIDMLVFGFFFNLDDKMRFVPELATQVPSYANGGISPDGLTITYHLRKSVKWQDGASFTARDVVFTVGAILNPRNNVAARVGWDDIASVDAVSDWEVRFHLKKIYAPAISTFFCESGLYPVLPAHVLARYPDINHVPFNTHPIGTGPFKFVQWVPGDRIELAASENYWRGRPKLDRIVYKIVPDAGEIVDALKTRQVDAWFRAPPDFYGRLHDLGGYRVFASPSLAYAHLDLNQRNPAFDDVRVRQAINYSIDKRAIIREALHGLADPAASDISPLSWAFEPHTMRYSYDPGKARELLAQAGWVPGPDGVLEKDNKRLAFSLSAVSGAATAQAIENMLQQQLTRAGFAVTIKNYPGDRFFAPYAQGGVLYRGQYDAALFSWVAGVDPDDSSEYMCEQIPPAGQNDLYWCDSTLGAAERAALSTYDRPERKKYYAITQAELASQSVTVFLYFARQVSVVTPVLRGYAPAPAISNTWNAWEWST